MPTLRVSTIQDSIVLHFGTTTTQINAYTLASALANFADAARAANSTVNPGYDIEVVVESLGSGSFRATFRTLFRSAENLFSSDSLRQIILGIIATIVYEQTLGRDPNVIVNVGPSEVVIEHGSTKVVVPREIHEAAQRAESDARFRSAIDSAMRTIKKDKDVLSFAVTTPGAPKGAIVPIRREYFDALPEKTTLDSLDFREIEEVVQVRILRAILQRSRRRWQFVWNGIPIAAPVLDDKFYNDFHAHRIVIAPGDILEVRLRIKQKRSPNNDIFVNTSYEVAQVISHLPRTGHDQLYYTDP